MMRKLSIGLSVVLALALAGAVFGGAGLIFGSGATVNGTAYSSTNVLGSVYPSRPVLMVQHGTMSATNAMTIAFQISSDGTNWITVDTFYPTSTTATNESYTPAYTAVPLYYRGMIVTTESVTNIALSN